MQPLAHFKTITHHRHLVCRYCFRLGLYRQGLLHDLSKYAPCEFWRGAKYYQGYRSPNDAERKQNGVSLAWLHHKGRNRHHFEYWIDYCIGKDGKPYMGGCKMPLRYVAEMFCDRIAACRTYPRTSTPTPRRMTTISARRAISSSTPRRATPSRRCCACSATRARTPRSPTFAVCCGRKRKENRQKPLFPRFLPCIFSFTGVNYLSNFAIGRTQLL